MELSNLSFDLWTEILKTLHRKGVTPSYNAKMKQCVITIELEPNQGQPPTEIKLFLNGFEKVVQYLEAAIYKQIQEGKIIPVDNEKGFISPKQGIFTLSRSAAKQILGMIWEYTITLDVVESKFNSYFCNDNLTPMSFVVFLTILTNQDRWIVWDAIKNVDPKQTEIHSFKEFWKEIFKIND